MSRVRTRAVRLAENAARQLVVYCKTGLPECYEGRTKKKRFESALYDWYPDLPWEKEGSDIAIQHILSKHGKTLVLVKRTFNFDMKLDLQKALRDE